jgi:hypothetical protein
MEAAFSLAPVRPELLDTPAVFTHRRFSDAVSDLNAHVYDKSRLLEQAVKMVDGLGIRIISAEAGINFNNAILVDYSRECDALDGVEVKRHNGNSHWCANRFGTEIRWVLPVEAFGA